MFGATGAFVHPSSGVNSRPGQLIVAGATAPTKFKRYADYVCEGAADEVVIQAAMDELADAGDVGIVQLIGRDFSISGAMALRDRVSLEAMESNVGATFTIAAGSDCHAFELAFKEGRGNSNMRGIYVNGNKANNTGGCGYVMPFYGLRVTNSGAGVANSTVQVTSTQIIFRRDGVADYTITLSNKPGTLISEIIDVVEGNNGWTVENSTGSTAGDPAVTDTLHCTTTPSDALAVVGATDTYTVDADLVLGITYDYFFIKCMTLYPDDYGWWAPKGHSIHFDRSVAEYAGKDGFHFMGSIDGIRMHGCYAALNVGNGYTIDATNPIISSCRSGQNAGHGFNMPGKGALLVGCQSEDNDETDKAGFFVGSSGNNVSITGCRSIADERGIQIEGDYCAVSGNNIINADVYGIYVSNLGTYNALNGNVVLGAASYGIFMAGFYNTISGNIAFNNRGNAQQCIDTGYNNVWTGNSEECYFVERTGNATLTAKGTNSKAIYKSTHATNPVTFQLPAATIGLEYSFAVGVDTKECRAKPASGESIAIDGVQQTADKYITANAINEFIMLKCLVPGTWEDIQKGGTWTAEA